MSTPNHGQDELIKYEQGDIVRVDKMIPGALFFGPIDRKWPLNNYEVVKLGPGKKLEVLDVSFKHSDRRTSMSPPYPISEDYLYRLIYKFGREKPRRDFDVPYSNITTFVAHDQLCEGPATLNSTIRPKALYQKERVLMLAKDYSFYKVINRKQEVITFKRGDWVRIEGAPTTSTGSRHAKLTWEKAFYEVAQAILVQRYDVYWKAQVSVDHNNILGRDSDLNTEE